MSALRDSIVPALIGSVLSGLGALVLSIYSDFVPALIPALQNVPTKTYVEIILLLGLVFFLLWRSQSFSGQRQDSIGLVLYREKRLGSNGLLKSTTAINVKK